MIKGDMLQYFSIKLYFVGTFKNYLVASYLIDIHNLRCYGELYRHYLVCILQKLYKYGDVHVLHFLSTFQRPAPLRLSNMKVACFLLVVLVASPLVESQLMIGGNDMDDAPMGMISPLSGGYSAMPVIGQPISRRFYGSNDMDDIPVSRGVTGFRTLPIIGQPLSLGGYQPISGVPYRSMYTAPVYSQPLVLGRPMYRPLVSRLPRRPIIRSPIVRRRSYCC